LKADILKLRLYDSEIKEKILFSFYSIKRIQSLTFRHIYVLDGRRYTVVLYLDGREEFRSLCDKTFISGTSPGTSGHWGTPGSSQQSTK
jgi:hypothetical protein